MKRIRIYRLNDTWAVMSPWHQRTLARARWRRYIQCFLHLLGDRK
jgi:hypothetical protein